MRSKVFRFVTAGVVLGTALFAPKSWTQVVEHPVLLALSKTDHTLSIVDPVTLKVMAKMPVGPDPHEVIASADGTRAWVSNMENSQGHELDVLDLVNHKALPSFDTAPMIGLHGLDFEGGKVWFTAQGGEVDRTAGSVDWAWLTWLLVDWAWLTWLLWSCSWGVFLAFQWLGCVCSQTRLGLGPRQQGRQVQCCAESALKGHAGGTEEANTWSCTELFPPAYARQGRRLSARSGFRFARHAL